MEMAGKIKRFLWLPVGAKLHGLLLYNLKYRNRLYLRAKYQLFGTIPLGREMLT